AVSLSLSLSLSLPHCFCSPLQFSSGQQRELLAVIWSVRECECEGEGVWVCGGVVWWVSGEVCVCVLMCVWCVCVRVSVCVFVTTLFESMCVCVCVLRIPPTRDPNKTKPQ